MYVTNKSDSVFFCKFMQEKLCTIIRLYFYYYYMINKTNVISLQKLQNRAMQIILGCSRYTPIMQMLRYLSCMNIEQLVEQDCMVFICKLCNGQLSDYFDKYKVKCAIIHGYHTRNRLDMYIETVKTDLVFRSIFEKGVIKFNELDGSLRYCNIAKKFNRCLKNNYLI